MFDRRLVQNFDYPLIGLVLLLAGIGILNLYSAGFNRTPEGATPVYLKQIYWLLAGLGLMFFSLLYHYRHYEKIAIPLYILSVALLVLVMVAGKTVSGSRRWLVLGPLTVQPSELTKVAIILVLSRYFSRRPQTSPLGLRDLLAPGALALLPALLIIKQPDLGSGLLVLAVAGGITLFAGVHWQTLALLAGTAVVGAPLAWPFLKDYQKQRLLTFLDPEKDPLGSGYHIIQSKIAVGSGQFWGKGFLCGTQSQLYFLPEQHTDFAFSVFAEEWGFAGSALLVLLYVGLILYGLMVARNCRDRFGQYLAVGVTALLFWQIFINLGMVTGLVPVVGIPLPFFSYGGSSLITTLLALGVLMNVRMRRHLYGG